MLFHIQYLWTVSYVYEALSTAFSMSVAFSSSLSEPLLSLNHACQHVLYSCVSCQYVPAPMSSRQIRLHMLYSANKVT